MTADELRELADALAIPSAHTYGPTEPQRQRTADYLRACADALEAGPVAWHYDGLDQIEVYPLAMPAAIRLPEPMSDAELREVLCAENWRMGPLQDFARAIEAEVIRRVKEANE